MFMKAITLFSCLIFYLAAAAQTKNASFSLIDKRVKTIDFSDPDTLARKLTEPYKTDIEKVRSIFKWITENIAYDVQGYHNAKGVYDGLWELSISSNASDTYSDYNSRVVRKVLKEKKAICDGYSRLFKTLCDYSKIRCEIINGYIRWASDPIGEYTNRRHAWNAVYINNSWKLIDATWASGYCDSEVTIFTKYYSDFYFFTKPVEFFNDHYPTENKWSLLPNTPSLYQFYNFPFYYPAFYEFKIVSLNPTSGFITVTSKNRKVQFELETNDKSKYLYAYESPYQETQTNQTVKYLDSLEAEGISDDYDPNYKLENKRIIYTYEIKSEKAQKLNVVYNGKLILTYGIRFRG
jgi:transglutaminase/protease-like cytokinesis protein 3